MKIAIISSGFLPVVDGVTITLDRRLQQLSQDGHRVLVFCPDYSPIASVYPNWQQYVGDILPGVRVVPLASTPFMGVEFERNPSKNSYHTVLQELEQFQPDVIHVDEPDRLFLGFGKRPGIEFAKRKRIPCVGFFHTNFPDYIEDFLPLPSILIAPIRWAAIRFITRRVYNAYDATLTASRVIQQKLIQMGIQRVICDDLLGVDSQQFTPALRSPHFFEQAYGLPDLDQKIKLLFLGRLTPDKGWRFTLAVLPKLMQTIDPATIAILIAGDGALRQQIEHRLKDIVPTVHFFGRVQPEQVPALLANSDIHVTASEKETRGLTVLEALAAGVPVLAPRAGGVIDSLQDGENGLLFEPKNERDFIQKLTQLVTDAQLRQAIGSRGRETVTDLSWKQAVEHLVTIWEHQIERKVRLKR